MIHNFNHEEAQPFYNTVQLSEDQWKDQNNKALALQKVIYKVFVNNPQVHFTGWIMKRLLEQKMKKKVNILSVRRCMSNLKNQGDLEKTALMRIGEEGQNEHFYCLPGENKSESTKPLINGEKTLSEILKSPSIQGEIFNNQ